jgi:hypothetical protein
MSVKDLPRSKLYPAEAAMFSKSLLVILARIVFNDLIKKLIDALSQLISDLEARTGEKIQILLSMPAAVCDANRDQLHGQLVKYTRGQISSPEKSVAASAVRIYDVLVSHDLRLAAKAYDVESLNLNALINDLKKEDFAQDLQNVNATSLLGDLEQSQIAFETVSQEKVEKKAQANVQILASFVAPIRRKIFQILTIVDTLEEFEPEVYKTAVNEINVLIDEYMVKIRTRTTLSEKPEPEAELFSK